MTKPSRKKEIIYLASPYTSPITGLRTQRYSLVTEVAAHLIRKGDIVFSPITMTHPIDQFMAGADATLGSDYWVDFDEAFMEFCSEMLILKIPGWDESSGVRREIDFFQQATKPIHFVEWDKAHMNLVKTQYVWSK